MEHIIQFGLSIDENYIVQQAVNKASDAIYKDVREEVRDISRGHYGNREELKQLFREVIKEEIAKLGDDFLLSIANQVASNLSRTKKVKELFDARG